MRSIRTLADYYADPFVQHRIREYCGATPVAPPSCIYFAALHADGAHPTWDNAQRFPVDACMTLLSSGADVARSMWDRSSLLVHLDIDYQNIDVPGEPYHHPIEVFYKLEPVYRATLQVLRRFGLRLLPVMTGRGYHFTGRVPLESDVTDRIAALAGETPAWVATLAQRRPAWAASGIGPRHARAYVGVGMLMEFLAHRILKRARRRSPIPIVLNGTIVGSGATGRECASLDVSYAGDPLDARHLRVAFGAYQKHRFQPHLFAGQGGVAERPPFVAVPRGRASLEYLLSDGRDLRHAARAARALSTALPNVSAGVVRAIEAYACSSLARFHRDFYATPRASMPLDALMQSPKWTALPECVRGPLLAPNDRLLQPAVIQHVTRVLMAEGLSPREIASVIQSRYAADFNWGRRWFWLDAQARAEFDVRAFAGLVVTGLDQGIDFNCRSAQEKGLCPGHPCQLDLRSSHRQLIDLISV